MRQNLAGVGIAFIVLLGLGLFYVLFVTDESAADVIIAPTGESVEGDWAVERSSVEAGSDEILTDGFNQTFAGYRVSILGPVAEAVGRTTEVAGGISIRDNEVSTDIAIATDKFFSDFELQDATFSDVLNVDEHPVATFRLARPLRLDPDMLQVKARTTGTLELAGVTKEVVVNLEAQLLTDPTMLAEFSDSSKVIQVVISAEINFEEFGLTGASRNDIIVPDSGNIEALINFVPAE